VGYYLVIPKRVDHKEKLDMAQKIIRQFIDDIDDIDGSEAQRTFSFAVDGAHYEIDLSSNNIKEFTDAIAGFIESARKVNTKGDGRRARKTALQL
jgi:hypothetical protein